MAIPTPSPTPSPGGQEQSAATIKFKIELDDSNMRRQFEDEAEESAERTGSIFKDVFSANILTMAVEKVGELWSTFSEGSEEAYQVAFEAESKLEQIMKRRFDASEKEINNIKNLATELNNGIIGENASMAAMQKLAMYTEESKAIGQLLPAIQNATAAQFGFNATAEDAADIGQRFGEALKGEAGGLEELGIFCSEAQAEILALGTEEEKVALLNKLVAENIGDMNQALANTDLGKQIQVNNTFLEAQETIGEFMTIMKSNFADIMIDAIKWLDEAAEKAVQFAKALGTFLEDIGLKKPTEEIEETVVALENTEEALEKVKETTGELASFDQFNLFGGGDESSINFEAEGILDDSEAIVEGMEEAEESIEDVTNSFNQFFEDIKNSNAWEIASEAVDTFKEDHLDKLGGAWEHLKEEAGEAWSSFAGFFLGNEDLTFFDALVIYISECAKEITTALTIIVDGIAGLLEMANNAGDGVGIFDKPYEGFEGFSLFGVPLIETVESAERHAAQQEATQQNITVAPLITIGGDQILDYIIDGINAKSAIKGYSVIK